jgi:hypothetical protein
LREGKNEKVRTKNDGRTGMAEHENDRLLLQPPLIIHNNVARYLIYHVKDSLISNLDSGGKHQNSFLFIN